MYFFLFRNIITANIIKNYFVCENLAVKWVPLIKFNEIKQIVLKYVWQPPCIFTVFKKSLVVGKYTH